MKIIRTADYKKDIYVKNVLGDSNYKLLLINTKLNTDIKIVEEGFGIPEDMKDLEGYEGEELWSIVVPPTSAIPQQVVNNLNSTKKWPWEEAAAIVDVMFENFKKTGNVY